MFRRLLERWRLLERVIGIAIAGTNVPAVAGMRLLKVREHNAGSVRIIEGLTMLDGHLAHPRTVSPATVILANGVIVRSRKARTKMVENWAADHNGAGILLGTKRAMICDGSTAVS
jgi:hypothetical protein